MTFPANLKAAADRAAELTTIGEAYFLLIGPTGVSVNGRVGKQYASRPVAWDAIEAGQDLCRLIADVRREVKAPPKGD